MIIVLFFGLFIQSLDAKCAVWLQYNHGYERLGYHAWVGYESLSKKPVCEDLEMFEQCKLAQSTYNRFRTDNGLNPIDIKCYNNIICAPVLPSGNGVWYCQNMDSYDMCTSIQDIIVNASQASKYEIICEKAVELTDRIPVLDYRKPDVYVPTTTTVANATTAPAAAAAVKPVMMLLLVGLLGVIL